MLGRGLIGACNISKLGPIFQLFFLIGNLGEAVIIKLEDFHSKPPTSSLTLW
jgi:hypothetical protein